MTLGLSGIVLLINSIVLYIVPEGRVAYWADWRLWGLSKSQWAEQHLTIGVLFLIAAILHMYYNWKAILAYLKNKAKELTIFTPAFCVALSLTLVVIVGTIAGVPPMSSLVSLGGYFKERAQKIHGEPPYGHAELSSLKSFASKEGLDLDKSLKLLQEAGLTGAEPGKSLKEIAAVNNKTPQAIYEVIKTAKIEQGSVLSGKPSLPDHPRPGFGNKTLAEVCRELRLDQGIILAGLKKQGISAQPDLTIKVIAADHGKEPIQLYEALRTAVNEGGGG
jgi:hypothetical protein